MEKPAVRAETLWKKAPSQVMSSVAFSSRVPSRSSTPVVVTTTLVWKVNFLKRNFLLHTSRITRKPMPPKMMRPQVVRFSSTSLW